MWRNLLSSQPLAFSVVGELRAHPRAAALVLAELTGLPIVRLATLAGGPHTLEGIEAEWFPPRERHTNDRSGFDAAAYAELEDGTGLLVTVEVKYTDSFSRAALSPDRYAEALAASGFDRSAAEEIVRAGGSQFLRSVLLTDSIRRTGVDGDGPPLDHALAVVLCREDDQSAAKVVTAIGERRPGTPVGLWTHRAFFEAAARQPELSAWARRMQERYLLPE